MKTPLYIGLIISLILISSSCNSDDDPKAEKWLIPIDQVLDGGPGRDGIPSIDNPDFISVDAVNFLTDDDLVVGIKLGNDVKAYPHDILDWHEIINDKVDSKELALVYCPLTGTGMAWNRMLNGSLTTFGVSGLLYNANIIPYDRKTGSNWSQMRMECVNGDLIGSTPEAMMVLETSWATWKKWFPNSQVVSPETGFNRAYGVYPYGDYRTNHDNLIFPVEKLDERLPSKQRTHGIIINGKAKGYNLQDFGSETRLIEDEFEGVPLVIVGNESLNFVVSFERKASDGTVLNFTLIEENGTSILKDQLGNVYDIFGYKVDESGNTGTERLTPTVSMMGYWFAWGTFYTDLELFE